MGAVEIGCLRARSKPKKANEEEEKKEKRLVFKGESSNEYEVIDDAPLCYSRDEKDFSGLWLKRGEIFKPLMECQVGGKENQVWFLYDNGSKRAGPGLQNDVLWVPHWKTLSGDKTLVLRVKRATRTMLDIRREKRKKQWKKKASSKSLSTQHVSGDEVGSLDIDEEHSSENKLDVDPREQFQRSESQVGDFLRMLYSDEIEVLKKTTSSMNMKRTDW
eukprot:CAMPEP_0167753392 /NCGR_PEP_ID=MMETSP0110_2-20121227/7687_1 /TAXON_ID=629695 /ORGANISM="Gymnochlora sp., Strain CCMP2014" /LENGTH=217 /DNA_ID=CAMNT_0007639151 /DNA_START=81 /DNA_END=731 /DNA_ORIENTATION=-